MNSITDEQITMARQVGILSYMRTHEPQELIKVGAHEYMTRTHDSLRISDNGLWNWCSQGFGGKNALDYLIRVKGMPFFSAVKELCGDPQGYATCQQEVRINSPPLIKPFELPKADRSNAAAFRYLYGRGIRDPVLTFCFEQGMIYQTDRKGYKNCAFVGKDAENIPRYACVRGCSGDFRSEASGSQKKYGFCIPARDSSTTRVEIYEAPIDALSGASLRVLAGRDWRTVHYLSLSGLCYAALDHFLQTHSNVKTLQLCLDNDEPGRTFARKLTEKYSAQGYTVKDLTPPKGKDVNEYLQMKLKSRSQREPER